MKNTIIFSLFCFLVCYSVHGQTQKQQSDSLPMRMASSSIEIPSYKKELALPQTWLMNMYGDYPVDLSSGLVDISIPIYEIKTPSLTLPITAKFHASGLRADEQIGTMGLRWIMNVDCMVSRKVKGYPDDCFYGSATAPFDNRVNDPNYLPDLATLYGGTAYNKEWYTVYAIPPNILTYLPDYSGPAAVFKDTEYDLFSYHLPSGKSGKFILHDSAGIKKACMIPYESVKVEVKRVSEHGHFNQVIITDENGTIYNYGKILTKEGFDADTDSQQINDDPIVVGWHLNAIISADKKDSILIEYQNLWVKTRNWLSTDYIIRDEFLTDYPSHWPPYPDNLRELFHDEFISNPDQDVVSFYESQITPYFNHLSKITFNGGIIQFNYDKIFDDYFLSSMEISDVKGVTVKKITFSYKKNEKLVTLQQLSSVDIHNESYGKEETYQFAYYFPQAYPTSDIIQSDWWGYYSEGRYGVMQERIVLFSPSFIPYTGSPQYADIGIGTHNDKNSDLPCMRVGMIESIVYPTGGRTHFDYESNFYFREGVGKEACGGLRIKSIENIAVDGKKQMKTYKYNPQWNGYGSMPEYLQPPIRKGKNFMNEMNVWAQYRDPENSMALMVFTEYKVRTYSNRMPIQFFDFYSNLVYYEEVVEYQGKENLNSGYTKYNYEIQMPQSTEYIHCSDVFKYINKYNSKQLVYVLPPDAKTGSRLWKKSLYNSDNQIVKETIYDYQTFYKGVLYDMPIKKTWQHKIGGLSMYDTKDAELIGCDTYMSQTYGYINQEYKLDAIRLSKETTHRYTPQGVVTEVKRIEYDPVHLLPVKEISTGRTPADSISITYKRPYHYTQSPYAEMVNKNILNTVVEKKVYKNNQLLETGTTNYKQWFTDIYAPMSFCYQKQGSNQEVRLIYEYNQHGQLQATTKDNSQKVVYIYNAYSQPVAVIDQATYGEVKAALGTTLIDRVARSYLVADNDMAKLNLLRQLLPNALVTTYTYKPLVGITSSTEPNEQTTYYEYDGFGRLKDIYIKNGNLKQVINSYEYNFK